MARSEVELGGLEKKARTTKVAKPRKKTPIRRADVPNLLRLIDVNEVMAKGMAKALEQSYEAFANAVRNGNFNKPGLDNNPILQGSMDGWISAVENSTITIRAALEKYLNLKH